jgi:hypothetical protein
LAWEPSKSDDVREYRVYRAQTDKPWLAEFARVGTVEGATFVYRETGLGGGKVYIYTVRAVGVNGQESRDSSKARTQPRPIAHLSAVPDGPREVGLYWTNPRDPHWDAAAFTVYRGVVHVATNAGSKGSWGSNDPEYSEPVVDRVIDITGIKKLADLKNYAPILSLPDYADSVDLTRKGAESADYKYAVYAYIVRAVNRLGTESGPSPYALTIPTEPQNVLLRETGRDAEIKWDRDRCAGYRVYRVDNRIVTRLTPEPIKETTVTVPNAGHARYVVVGVDGLGQEGQPSSPVWSGQSYQGFFEGPWHQ